MAIVRILFLFILLNSGSVALGQYFQFSQYNLTDQRTNPAISSTLEYATVNMLHRNQQASDNFNLKSTFLSASYPFRRTKGATSAISLSFLDDRAGEAGVFRTNSIGLSYSVSVPMRSGQQLGFGVKTDWQGRRVSLDGLFTGSQFIPGRGFEGVPSDGAVDQFQASFFTWSAGFFWNKKSEQGHQKAHLGISLFDINRPDESFFSDDSKLPSSFVLSTGAKVFENQMWSVYPELLLTATASRMTTILGAITSYDLNFQNSANSRLNLITKYAFAGYVIAGIQFEMPKTSFGFSYDLPTSRQVGNNSAVEFSFQWRKPVEAQAPKNKVKRRRVKRSKYARNRLKRIRQAARRKRRNRSIQLSRNKKNEITKPTSDKIEIASRINVKDTVQHENDESLINNTKVQQDNKVEEVEGGQGDAKAGLLQRHSLDIEEIHYQFKFSFNKSEIQPKDEEVLKDMVELLLDDEGLKVDIVGHTDNIGSEASNQVLSLRRAQVVRKYLIMKGIKPERIYAEGRGENDPLVENDSDHNRALNRRVEFRVHY